MGQVLSVPVFGSGIVLEGSSDAQRTDEVAECDGYDIGERGQLVAASDLSAFANATGSGSLDLVYALKVLPSPQLPRLIYVGDQAGATFVGFAGLDATIPGGIDLGGAHVARYVVTFAFFPIVKAEIQLRAALVCVASRQAFNQREGLGLFVVTYDPLANAYSTEPIRNYDALGTGLSGEFPGGTNAKQLYPRFILAYNSSVLLCGLDDHDTAHGDGANRVMFSNINNPLKYGNDPLENDVALDPTKEVDRAFVDSDAILIGGSGTVLRAGIVWGLRAYLGSNEGLFYIEGYGRESLQANGPQAVSGTQNVVGPNALIEGPDGNLHGVSDVGHWMFDGTTTHQVGNKLRDYRSKSFGFWDCIWTDPFRLVGSYPGQTNQDLVWMFSDVELGQVMIGIPFCNATSGFGAGGDTVVIKYHVKTGGYTRQVFVNKTILSVADFRREHTADRQRFMAGTASLPTLIAKYRAKSTAAASPIMPTPLPTVTFGPYAPFGPDGVGVMRKRYLTIAFEVFSLPIVFLMTPNVDGQNGAPLRLTIGATQPSAPANGDLWLDTSQSDTNLGNGTGGALIPANVADYILRRWITSWGKWVNVPGGGQQGLRVTVPLAFDAQRGTRLTVRMQCITAGGRYQVEGFSEQPAIVREGM